MLFRQQQQKSNISLVVTGLNISLQPHDVENVCLTLKFTIVSNCLKRKGITKDIYYNGGRLFNCDIKLTTLFETFGLILVFMLNHILAYSVRLRNGYLNTIMFFWGRGRANIYY